MSSQKEKPQRVPSKRAATSSKKETRPTKRKSGKAAPDAAPPDPEVKTKPSTVKTGPFEIPVPPVEGATIAMSVTILDSDGEKLVEFDNYRRESKVLSEEMIRSAHERFHAQMVQWADDLALAVRARVDRMFSAEEAEVKAAGPHPLLEDAVRIVSRERATEQPGGQDEQPDLDKLAGEEEPDEEYADDL